MGPSWVLQEAVLGLRHEHHAAGSWLNPCVTSPTSETHQMSERSVFAQENPAWGELEADLCYCRDTLCNSLPDTQTCQLGASQLPSPSPASSWGGHGA